MKPASTAPLAAAPLAALAAILLAAGCASSSAPGSTRPGAQSPRDSLQAENQRLREANADLRDSLRFRSDIETGRYHRELRGLRDRIGRMSYALTLFREGGRTVEVIPADALFEPASARLSSEGRTRLDTLAARIQRTYPERRLLVEGHTDSAALSEELQETYPSNWELAALRAAAVTRYLTQTAGLDKERLALAAYADTRPAAPGETASAHRQNRRVRVAVLPDPGAYSDADEESW